jgi:hypothetical protein
MPSPRPESSLAGSRAGGGCREVRPGPGRCFRCRPCRVFRGCHRLREELPGRGVRCCVRGLCCARRLAGGAAAGFQGWAGSRRPAWCQRQAGWAHAVLYPSGWSLVQVPGNPMAAAGGEAVMTEVIVPLATRQAVVCCPGIPFGVPLPLAGGQRDGRQLDEAAVGRGDGARASGLRGLLRRPAVPLQGFRARV